MKIRAERQDFAEAVSWATRTAGSRPAAMRVLSGVLLEAVDGRLVCRATDLETSVEISLPVQVDEPGRVVLPGKLLSQLVAKLPDEPVHLEGGTGDRLSIRCGRASYEVRGMGAEDFPALPVPADDASRGVLKADAFQRLVSQVARAAGTDDARPVLTGVKLEAVDGALRAVATDSYRLALRSVAWDAPVEAEALVPAKALQEAAKAAGDAGGDVTMVFEESRVTFLLGDRHLSTTLVEGTFPAVSALLPDSHDTLVVLDRAALIEALRRVAVVSLGMANAPVTLAFDDGGVELAATNQEYGEAREALAAKVDGEGLTIAFNPDYVLSGLDAIATERVRIELRGGLKPAVLRPQHDGDDGSPTDTFTYLLMPMRVS